MTVTATANAPVQVLQLYVDGKKSFETGSTTLNTSLKLTTGTHRLAAQALDKYGKITKTVKYVTISDPVSTPPPPPPAPTGTTFDNLQESSSWQTCGSCGNAGGTGLQATYLMTRGITNPAMDSNSTSAQFSIGGNYPYANAYWFLRNTAPTTGLKSLVYDFYIYVPQTYASAPQAIEFECQHTVNGYAHNFAWQADYARKQWRIFDYINHLWIATPVPFASFTPGTWHHVVAEYHENGTDTIHDALSIDGVRTVVNITQPGKYTGQTWASFTNAFQLDLNGTPTAFSVYVDKMKVTYE